MLNPLSISNINNTYFYSMQKYKRRLQSDINLLINATETFQFIYPFGFNLFLDYSEKAMYDICTDLLNGKGFSIEEPLEYVDETLLFNLMKCLERCVMSQQANIKNLKDGYITKVFKVAISKVGDEDSVWIYNRVKAKDHKFKFFLYMHNTKKK